MNFLKPMYFFILFAITFMNCKAQEDLKRLDILLGTWKVENKSTHETWEKVSDSYFKGESFILNGTNKLVTEYISLNIIEGKVTYKATVKNQNHGSTISFKLNETEKGIYSFENLEHDFPKKIQYKVISNDKLLVNVLGENDQGFSYYLIRQ